MRIPTSGPWTNNFVLVRVKVLTNKVTKHSVETFIYFVSTVVEILVTMDFLVLLRFVFLKQQINSYSDSDMNLPFLSEVNNTHSYPKLKLMPRHAWALKDINFYSFFFS